MYSAIQFFNDLFEEQQVKIRCLGNGRRSIDLNGFYNENLTSNINQLNEQGYEIYYVPNSGGYKDAEIIKINTVFVDLDCGRNEDGRDDDLGYSPFFYTTSSNETARFPL